MGLCVFLFVGRGFLQALDQLDNAIQIVAVVIIDIYAAATIVAQGGHFCGKRALHSIDQIFQLYALLLFGLFDFGR